MFSAHGLWNARTASVSPHIPVMTCVVHTAWVVCTQCTKWRYPSVRLFLWEHNVWNHFTDLSESCYGDSALEVFGPPILKFGGKMEFRNWRGLAETIHRGSAPYVANRTTGATYWCVKEQRFGGTTFWTREDFTLFRHHNKKYGHTIRSSFLATCFGSLRHQQVFYFFLHSPVFVCWYSYIGQCLHIGMLVTLGIWNSVINKRVVFTS
jgi:hypothetical protein